MADYRTAAAEWKSTSVESGGAVIAAQSLGGSELPSLLLIGAATWSRDWWPDDLCRQLHAAGLRVIRYDARDTGASTTYPPGEPGYTASDLVDDGIALLDALDIDRSLVLGISMGGGVAQQLAAMYPQRVAGLILVSTSPADVADRQLPGPTPEIQASFVDETEPDWRDRDAVIDWIVDAERPYAGPGGVDEPALRELLGRVWERSDGMASAAANHFVVAGSADPVDLSALRGIPALVAHGSHDPLFPLAHGQALAEAVGAPLLVLDGVGHELPPSRTWPVLVPEILKVARRSRDADG